MAFESGSISFRLFYLTQQYDSSLLEEFAKRIAVPLEQLDRHPITGWVSGRHLLDREITDEKCVVGPYLHVQQFKAEKKIPASLFKAYVHLEEDIELRARQLEFLPRKAKAEVKARVTEMLLPRMPPTLTGIPLVVDFRNDLAIAGAMSDNQIDAFVMGFKETANSTPILLTAESAALKRKQINANDLTPFHFSPDEALEPPQETTLGMDFLTWLWYIWEKEGAVHHLPDGREFGIMLEGPVTFFREGQGAHEVALRKGLPLNSREAGTALACGKKLKRVKFTLAVGEDVYAATMDADFAIRSLKLPKGEQDTPHGKFEERMLFIETFWTAWLALYDRFLDARISPDVWPKTLKKMRTWIAEFDDKQAQAYAE